MTGGISIEEWRWRAWFLGEGAFRSYGRRNPAHRHETGAPERIPDDWWVRLEDFLTRRGEGSEKPPPKPSYPTGGPNPMVSEHFSVREFDCHNGKRVPQTAYRALVRLADVFLEPLRAEFGTVFVTSGYRPVDYNKSVGGAPFSQHIYELTPDAVAADVIPKHGTPAAWGRFLREIADKARVGGSGIYPTFTHIDNGPRRNW